MLLFALIALTVVGLLTLWLHRRLVVAPRWATPWRYAGTPLLVALTALAVVAAAGGLRWGTADDTRPVAAVALSWLVVALYLSLLLAAAQLGAARRLARHRRVSAARPAAPFNRATAPLAVVAALGTTAYGVVEAADPTVTRTTHTSAELPAAFDGTTVALVTDLHAGVVHGSDFAQQVVDRVNAAEPDLVVLSGDVVDAPFERHRAEIAPLADLEAPLGVFAVTGNHEMYTGSTAEWVAEWERLGITVLANASAGRHPSAPSRSASPASTTARAPASSPRSPTGHSPAPRTAFTLYLAHQPLMADGLGRPRRRPPAVRAHPRRAGVAGRVARAAPAAHGGGVSPSSTASPSSRAAVPAPGVRPCASPQPPEIPLITLRRG